MSRFETVAGLGLGLLGGSVAWAARERGAAARVVAGVRRPEAACDALRRGVVDEALAPEEAVRGAELVVLATPVHAMAGLARRVAPALAPGAVVTDVGSVKGCLHETLPGILPQGAHYVGSHPMAGSHETGIAHARADLFEGAPCAVSGGGDAAAVERVCAFWRALGARVVRREPGAHDAEVAWASHAPHALAFAFGAALRAAPAGARELRGPGFRDFTRIGHGDPELWADILTANRKAVAAPLHAFREVLGELVRAVEAGDASAVERFIAAARGGLDGTAAGDSDPEDRTSRNAREGTQGDDTTTHE